MAIKYGKTQVQKMIDAIDQDHASAEDAALAALAVAEELLEERAKFVVVGQLVRTAERGELEPSDPESIKVALGYYSTEGDAIRASESLWYSSATGDRWNVWALPMFYGTPAEMHAKQKAKYAEAEAKAAEKAQAKLDADLVKRRQAMEERARGGKGSCAVCTHQPYDHSSVGNGKGRCYVPDCKCPKWEEKTK
jgi:hypothetical protein